MAQFSPELKNERRRLRELRSALPDDVRARAERAIARTIERLRVIRPGRRVAVYLAMPGEVNLEAVVRRGWSKGTLFYAPRILHARRRSLGFLPLRPEAALERNFYGLLEPSRAERRIPLARLDVVLVPLLGFDRAGHRIGMGGGYYDRALRRRVDSGRSWRKPRLIGIAYACQEVPAIAAAGWDVALDLIVTEAGVIHPRTDASR